MNHLICDGYNEPGYIAAVEGLHPELRFTYRPPLLEELAEHYQGISKLKDSEANKAAAAWIAKRLVNWDVGEQATPANLLRLRPQLFLKFVAVVRGERPSDLDPQLEQKRREQEEKDRADAATAGKSLADFRAERDAKN